MSNKQTIPQALEAIDNVHMLKFAISTGEIQDRPFSKKPSDTSPFSSRICYQSDTRLQIQTNIKEPWGYPDFARQNNNSIFFAIRHFLFQLSSYPLPAKTIDIGLSRNHPPTPADDAIIARRILSPMHPPKNVVKPYTASFHSPRTNRCAALKYGQQIGYSKLCIRSIEHVAWRGNPLIG